MSRHDPQDSLQLKPIILRNFQYLAALYAGIFLDRYFNRRTLTG